MTDYKPIVVYSSYNNSIVFPKRIASGLLPDFAKMVTNKTRNTSFGNLIILKKYPP